MNEQPLSPKKWYNFVVWSPALMAYALGLGVSQIEGAFSGIAAVIIGGILSVAVAIMVDRLVGKRQ